ncbi:MAG: hypothetical protein GY953_37715 [bacterium]|nr:hypothetical protein [bacterium]
MSLIGEVTDGVALLTLSRPAKLNALDRDTFHELGAWFDAVIQDSEVRVIIITGAGEKAFVAGADISNLTNLNALTGREWSLLGQRVFSKIEDCPKPVIAAINGYALGGGLELALACHIRLASANAKFGQPEVKIGWIPGNGGTQRLPRLIGASRALELILTGDLITAEQANAIGLVNKVLPLPELLPAARELAGKIAANAPVAVGAALSAVQNGLGMTMEAALEYEASQTGLVSSTEDAKEGARAFLEKRPPKFLGK